MGETTKKSSRRRVKLGNSKPRSNRPKVPAKKKTQERKVASTRTIIKITRKVTPLKKRAKVTLKKKK